MSNLDRFKTLAKSYGAALLYAPEVASDPLENLGSFSLPDGVLENEAALIDPGLVAGGASASLDGSDYIETNWKTRSNVSTNPRFQTSVSGWSVGAGGETLTWEKLAGVFPCARITTDGSSNAEGIQASPDFPVVGGRTYTQIAIVLGTAGQQLRLLLWNTDGTIGNNIVTFETGGLQLVAVERTMPADATLADPRIATNGIQAVTFFLFFNGLIEGSIAELEEEFGSLERAAFPLNDLVVKSDELDTQDHLATGLAGWSGTVDNSASDIGWAARGTARTFVVMHERKTAIENDYLFRPLGAFLPNVRLLEDGDDRVWLRTDGSSVTWDANSVVEVPTLLTLTINDAIDGASLYMNNALIEAKTGIGQFVAPAGQRLIFGASGDGLNGKVVPVVVFPSELSDSQVQELNRAAFGLPLYSRVAVKQEFPPDRAAIRIEAPNGTIARWAEDEPTAENILSDIVVDDEIPGGSAGIEGTLARDPQVEWRDLEEYAKMIAYQPGVEIIGEAFFDKGAGSSGERQAIAPKGLGWQAVFNDDNAARVIYIDGDINKFTDPSAQRKVNLLPAILLSGTNEIGWQKSGAVPPSIAQSFEELDGGKDRVVEAIYDGGGYPLGKLRYDRIERAQTFSVNAAWETIAALIDTDTTLNANGNFQNHQALDATNQVVATFTQSRKFARFFFRRFNQGALIGENTWSVSWEHVKVIGQHGLAEQGTWPDIGFTVQQMLVHFINNFCGPLHTSDEAVEDDGFIVPQAAFNDPTSLSNILNDLTKYALYDWFVYNGFLFEHRKPGTYGKFWKTQVVPSELNELGIDSQRLWRSIVVQFTAADGSTRTVGPPGSFADVETPDLEITDPDHPAVRAQRTRRDVLDLRGIGSFPVAIKVGERFLEEANLLNRSGSAKLSGYVQDELGIFYPVARVKSGDWISFTDSPDKSFRKIIRKSYKHNDRSAEIDIDAPSSGLDALLERLQVGLISLGVT